MRGLWRLYKRNQLELRYLANGHDRSDVLPDYCDLLRPSAYQWHGLWETHAIIIDVVGDSIRIRAHPKTDPSKEVAAYIPWATLMDAANGYDGGYVGLMIRCRNRLAAKLSLRLVEPQSRYENAA